MKNKKVKYTRVWDGFLATIPTPKEIVKYATEWGESKQIAWAELDFRFNQKLKS